MPPSRLTTLARHLYRIALDVAFRRSGGLLLVLTDKRRIGEVVRPFDLIEGRGRADTDRVLDKCLVTRTVQGTPRALLADVAALDGAIIVSKSGEILAYGAVVDPKQKGRMRPAEGSRTKAALSGSRYGVAIKISSDGDIAIYESGEEFLRL